MPRILVAMLLAPDATNQNFALLLSLSAERWPDRVLLVEEAQSRTFREISQRAAGFAAHLRAAGVAPGDRVCISTGQVAQAVSAFFGALSMGAVGCLINREYRRSQLTSLLANAKPRALVCSADVKESLPRETLSETAVVDPFADMTEGPLVPIVRRAGDLAQITYTSGSTGGPKGVVASHGNLWAGAIVVPAFLGLSSDDRIGSILPLSGVYGFSQLTCALITGATLVVEHSLLPRDLISSLRAARVTVLAGVPSHWARLLDGGLAESPLESLRVVTNAGGHLAPELVRALRRSQPQAALYLMYGLTEVFRSTFLPPGEVDASPDSIGRAVPGSEVLVLREDGTECAVGEIGELVHRGPTVALGYWNDPHTTAKVFRQDPTREGAASGARRVFSGDLVRRDEQGLLYFVGRRDGMIKTLGYRVSPDEVTEVLIASRLVTDATVTAEPDPRRGERIVAHVSLKRSATLVALKHHVRNELPRYMQPVRYELYDALPYNSSGKPDLFALRREG